MRRPGGTGRNGDARSEPGMTWRPHAPGGSRGAAGDKRMESRTKREKPADAGFEAVSEGFEPPVRCRTPVFEAGSFNHSDNSPGLGVQRYEKICRILKNGLFLHSLLEQGRSSVGSERLSHIQEVIGSTPIVPTRSRQHLAGGFSFLYL